MWSFRSIRLSIFLPRPTLRSANGRVAPQIAGTSWNSQRDLKRVKITAEEATEASLSKAVLSGGPGVRGGREGASQRHDIHFITLKPTVGSTRALDFQWCLRGWSKWWYKRISCTKNTMGRWTKAGGCTNCSGACRNIFSQYLCLKPSLEVRVILMSIKRSKR